MLFLCVEYLPLGQAPPIAIPGRNQTLLLVPANSSIKELYRRERANLIKIAHILVILVIWLTSSPLLAANTPIQFVVHPSVADTQLSVTDLKQIFTMRKISWSNGDLLQVFVYEKDQTVHQKMCKEVLNMFPYQLERHWNKLAYSGLGSQPERVKSLDEMLTKVSNTPGAIGYVIEENALLDLARIKVVGG